MYDLHGKLSKETINDALRHVSQDVLDQLPRIIAESTGQIDFGRNSEIGEVKTGQISSGSIVNGVEVPYEETRRPRQPSPSAGRSDSGDGGIEGLLKGLGRLARQATDGLVGSEQDLQHLNTIVNAALDKTGAAQETAQQFLRKIGVDTTILRREGQRVDVNKAKDEHGNIKIGDVPNRHSVQREGTLLRARVLTHRGSTLSEPFSLEELTRVAEQVAGRGPTR